MVAFLFLWLFREDIKALLLRIATIKLPGGAELSTLQSERQIKEERIEDNPLPTPEQTVPGLPDDLNQNQRCVVENIIRAERATSYLWEYRYLNHFLVYRTQHVLDWLISLGLTTTYSYYDATWLPFTPSAHERGAIISALEAHHLIQVTNGTIQVTPKGVEYQHWRGILPDLTVEQ